MYQYYSRKQTFPELTQHAPARSSSSIRFLVLFVLALSWAFMPEAYAQQAPQFAKEVSSSSNSMPFNSNAAQRVQTLYFANDLISTSATTPTIATSGLITRVYFKANSVGNGTYLNLKVKLGQTTANGFAGVSNNVYYTNLTTVFDSSSFSYGSTTADQWLPIDLTTPFLYDAGKTLIIEVSTTGRVGTTGFTVRTSSSPSNMPQRRIYGGTATAITGTADRTWPDFGIDVAATPPCTTPPAAGIASASVAFVCPGVNFQLSTDGATIGSDITYQWQSSTDGVNWTNITGATNSIYTASQSATTSYRAQTICSGISSASNAVTVVTNTTPMSGVYTVNQNAPFSTTGNYPTISDLMTDMTCRGISGPVTVNVVSGTGPYNEQVIIPAITGASATNTITFNGNGNTVSFDATSANRSIFRLDGADHVTIDNFILTSIGSYGWIVQLSNGADHNVISNNTLNASPTGSTEANTTGVVFSNSNTALTAGNTGNNNLIIGNTINGGYKGIHLASAVTEAGNNQIKNNIIKDFHATGIMLDAAKNTLVENNDLSRPTRTSSGTFTGIELKNHAAGNIIARNRIHNTHDLVVTKSGQVNGIYLNANDAASGEENIVKNNLIYKINNTNQVYAIYNNNSNGNLNYHNTIVLDSAHTTNVRAFYQTGAATNVAFSNNLVYMSATGSGTKHAVYLGTIASAVTVSNNAYFIDPVNATATSLGYYGVNFPTLSDWQTANSNAFDQQAIFADPQFDNPATGNFAPTNSVLNDVVQALAAVTNDINGTARGTNTDPGAYEFTPVGNDAGVVALISPVSPATPNTPQNIEVSIKNFGASALTSMLINWSVNGVAQTPFNWTGSLAGGQVSGPVTIGTFTFASSANTVEICTASPNGTTDSNPVNDCFTTNIYACAPLAGTYTIDQNSPVSATNFQSIATAAQILNNCGISAPVVFNVTALSGPYNEAVEFAVIPGASATNIITFNGNSNTVSFKGDNSNRTVVKLDGTDHLTFTDFTIAATDSTLGWGIHFTNGADHNTISNNNIVITSVSTTESNSAGIVFSNATSAVTVTGNTGNNNLISGNTISGGYKAIQLSSELTSAGNNQIVNNIIKDFYADGIKLQAAKGTLVEGNDISRPGRAQVTTFSGIEVAGGSVQNVISKNRIHNTHGGTAGNATSGIYGIYFASNDAPAGSENIVKNNLIYNTNNTGTIYALYNVGSDGVYMYHNTIDISNANNTGNVRGFYQTGAATNIRFVNNIVNIASGASGNKHGVYFNTPASAIISNNNVFYTAAGNVGYDGGDFLTLADWKAASNNAYDQQSVYDNPLFINAATGNYEPNAVGIDNVGQPVAAVTTDINGAPRSTTTPDAGAYEFSVPVDNVGIIAISGPAANCGLSNQESITVTIKNFGTSTQTNIPVTYSLNGNSIATTEVFTGSLAYNATANFTFAAKADMSASGPYIIIASTLLPSDNNTSNDTDTLRVTNSLMPAGNINIDFETVATGVDAMRKVVNTRSAIMENTAASFGATSTKGMIMDGVNHTSWTIPAGINNPWNNNPENFAGVYLCTMPTAAGTSDSLILSFDLKQLYKGAASSTNFRVTVNGQQIGKTYNPPFNGYGAGGATWSHVRINLTAYLNQPTIQIGLESSVKEGYDNGNGTANLLDNIKFEHFRVTTGLKDALAANAISVYPNPNNGIFNVKLNGLKEAATVAVYNLAGQLIATENVKAGVQETSMHLKGLAAGTYLLKVTSENKVKVTRLIVQ